LPRGTAVSRLGGIADDLPMNALTLPVRFALAMPLLCSLTLGGCATGSERAQQLAARSGLSAALVEGAGFQHQIFAARAAPGTTLYVFIDGDGTPWVRGGTQIAPDSTPRQPLALQLAAQTHHAVLYLGRPCTYSARADAACRPGLWTSERYSAGVVHSMATALDHYAEVEGYRSVVLVGYSGGGALAVLMAPQVPTTRAVITLAANLDVGAWTRAHGYLPLTGSLDPSAEPALPAALPQWHLIGGRDSNVPEALNQRYFSRLRSDQLWRYPEFDHVCCWVEQWPAILARIDAVLSGSSPP
jgi:dienelactone hydrolase